jgi:hypothetical protein
MKALVEVLALNSLSCVKNSDNSIQFTIVGKIVFAITDDPAEFLRMRMRIMALAA